MSEKLTAEYEPQFEIDKQGNRIGVPVTDDQTPLIPRGALIGTYTRLEPLDADRHTSDLFTAFAGADHLWIYMPHGPFFAENQNRVTTIHISTRSWISTVGKLWAWPVTYGLIQVLAVLKSVGSRIHHFCKGRESPQRPCFS